MVVGSGLKPRPEPMTSQGGVVAPSRVPTGIPGSPPPHLALCHLTPLAGRKGCHGEHLAGQGEGGVGTKRAISQVLTVEEVRALTPFSPSP